ncbi:MAG: RecQ family ATP-dependent DNA helicase [Desulfobacterales bacterium]|nr:RecQ family ATP-dependent DNA helicase [Desulfobacterales bacterium]
MQITDGAGPFLRRCVLIDLEAGGGNAVWKIGAIFDGEIFERKGTFNTGDALLALDRFSAGADFVLGHNIIGHDLPVLESINPDLGILRKPVIDTLYLSPLAFPENPYHRLIKDYKLVRDSVNNPVADARLAGSVFRDQWISFRKAWETTPDLLAFYRFCFEHGSPGTGPGDGKGLATLFEHLGARELSVEPDAFAVWTSLTKGKVCPTRNEGIASYLSRREKRAVLAYCLAWLQVAGGNSVLPPWVRHRFEDITLILKQLRDVACNDDACPYCIQAHNPVCQLQRYYPYEDFRPLPDGRALQREIVAHGLSDLPHLGILPTGFGKSICFQLPALVRYYRRGVLTVVISPLQALMKDQVDNLRRLAQTDCVAAVYGMLTPPERGDILERIRLGDIGIVYMSPEQLRNRSVRKALSQREIGCWVFDECHCLSKWGHDFRPDYLYAARFIREFSEKQHVAVPPIACFTATARQDVSREILDHFREHLNQDLTLFQGGVERENLFFEVQPVGTHEKFSRVKSLIEERLGNPPTGSAIIYCAKRDHTEQLATFLANEGLEAEAFHGGLSVPDKRRIQEAFISGEVPVICCTNAFGMGIDKDNVRLVIHYEIPGSLENYVQEAGRAGRDTKDAECILLYDEQDIETQFSLGAVSALRQRDIAQILNGLRRSRYARDGEVVITAGELLRDDQVDTTFDSQDYSADTRVRVAVAWLERAGFVERNGNSTLVFQGKPRFSSLEEMNSSLDKLQLSEIRRTIWETILEQLMDADPEDGMSADQLAEAFGTVPSIPKEQMPDTRSILQILNQMAEIGLIRKGMMLSAYVRMKGGNNAKKVLNRVCEIDQAMLGVLQEAHPVETVGEWVDLNLRWLNQRLLDKGFSDANPEVLKRLLDSLSRDGRGFAGRRGSIRLQHINQSYYRVRFNRAWAAIAEIANRRRNLAYVILDALYGFMDEKRRASGEIFVEFSVNDLSDAIRRDMTLQVQPDKMLAAIDRGLLFLHDHKVIILQKGLAVFRQAMTIRIVPESTSRRYTKGDFEPVAHHNKQRVLQVHVMNEYARLGIEKIRQALALVLGYFTMDHKSFIRRFFKGRENLLEMATSEESYQRVVETLKNPVQEAVVAGRADRNTLILAGPGSGKTRVVIHRCAYLLRVERVPGKSILMLCFNHATALNLRKRLWELVGTDAAGVTILTYHGLAMRLTGRCFSTELESGKPENAGLGQRLDDILQEAIQLLSGHKEIPGLEPDEIRERLLSGYQHILVDEYQDIDERQYQLISALAGRSIKETEAKLCILAVGDDDQSIYGFRNANVAFIRKFREDYHADVHYLVENYRSTHHIIQAANSLISHNRGRMKTGHSICINRFRKHQPSGGTWEVRDPVSKGKVQILTVADCAAQAGAVVQEIRRLQGLYPEISLDDIAVLARNGMNHPELSSVRSALECQRLPFSYALDREVSFSVSRIREVHAAVQVFSVMKHMSMAASDLIDAASTHGGLHSNPWQETVCRLLEAWQQETGNAPVTVQCAIDFMMEAVAEQRREQRIGHGIYLSTAHGVKGLEFSHVFILDGAWRNPPDAESLEEERRLYYVSMTRAQNMLTVFRRRDWHNPHAGLIDPEHVVERIVDIASDPSPESFSRRYAVLGMKHLFLDYAGRKRPEDPVHEALRRLNTGDILLMQKNNEQVLLATAAGVAVARLSKVAAELWKDQLGLIEQVAVIGIVRRRVEDTQPEFRPMIRNPVWEIPLVEIRYRSKPV